MSSQPRTIEELAASIQHIHRNPRNSVIVTPRSGRNLSEMPRSHRDIWRNAETLTIAAIMNLSGMPPGTEIGQMRMQTDSHFIENDRENISERLMNIITYISERTR